MERQGQREGWRDRRRERGERDRGVERERETGCMYAFVWENI